MEISSMCLCSEIGRARKIELTVYINTRKQCFANTFEQGMNYYSWIRLHLDFLAGFGETISRDRRFRTWKNI